MLVYLYRAEYIKSGEEMVHINKIFSFDEFKNLPDTTKDLEFTSGNDDNHAWKLHIFLDQNNKNISHPIIEKTIKFFIDNKISFKMGNGGDEGKVFTAYIGDIEEALHIGKLLDKNFGAEYKKEYPIGVNLPEDLKIFDNIGLRFEGCMDNWKKQDSVFSYYGYQGIPTFRRGEIMIDNKDDLILSGMACHIFLAEKCGHKYLGKNYQKNRWDKFIFEPLKSKYSYDEINSYVSKALQILRSTHQEYSIYQKNLVSKQDSVNLSIDEILYHQTNKQEMNFQVSHLEIFPDADNIRIFKNKYGNTILEYKKGEKALASCSLENEDSLIRLYSTDDSCHEYINYARGEIKEIRNNVEYPVSLSMRARINNIAVFSKALYNKKKNYNKTVFPLTQRKSSYRS